MVSDEDDDLDSLDMEMIVLVTILFFNQEASIMKKLGREDEEKYSELMDMLIDSDVDVYLVLLSYLEKILQFQKKPF